MRTSGRGLSPDVPPNLSGDRPMEGVGRNEAELKNDNGNAQPNHIALVTLTDATLHLCFVSASCKPA